MIWIVIIFVCRNYTQIYQNYNAFLFVSVRQNADGCGTHSREDCKILRILRGRKSLYFSVQLITCFKFTLLCTVTIYDNNKNMVQNA